MNKIQNNYCNYSKIIKEIAGPGNNISDKQIAVSLLSVAVIIIYESLN